MTENAKAVRDALDERGTAAVDLIVEVSTGGLSPKNDEAIFALAMAAGHPNDEVKAAALGALPAVCRIGTHLFMFLGFRVSSSGAGGVA